MKITQMLLTPNVYSRPLTPLKKIKKVVIHYVGNPMSTAQNNRDYFNNAESFKKYISAHYVVGLEGEIIACVPENEVAYCSNQANDYSISIETCHPDSGGKFNVATEQALVELTADIVKRYNLNVERDVIRHYDVTGKCCPRYYVENPMAWEGIKGRIRSIVSPVKPHQELYYIWCGKFTSKEKAEQCKKLINEVEGKPYCEVRRV